MSKEAKPRSDGYYHRIYALFRPLFLLVCRAVYGVKVDKPRRYEGGTLILSNHTSDLDFLVVASHIAGHMYFVASEHVTAMGLFGKLFRRWFSPITVTKGSYKMAAVTEIIRRIRRGNRVLLFPEGRLSHNGKSTYIAPSTAKLAKRLGCTLVTFRSKGGFFIEPRWQTYLNKGRLFEAGIVHEYSPQELEAMTVEEVLEHIRQDLYVDAYEEQGERMQPFKFRHGLRDVIRYYDLCPACGGLDCLRATEEKVSCPCGWELTMDQFGFFREPTGKISTAADWEQLQLQAYAARFQKGEPLVEDGVRLLEIGQGFDLKELAVATVTGTAQGLSIEGELYPYSEMALPEILSGGRRLEFTCRGRDYMLEKDAACLNKFAELYKLAQT